MTPSNTLANRSLEKLSMPMVSGAGYEGVEREVRDQWPIGAAQAGRSVNVEKMDLLEAAGRAIDDTTSTSFVDEVRLWH